MRENAVDVRPKLPEGQRQLVAKSVGDGGIGPGTLDSSGSGSEGGKCLSIA